MGYTTIRTALLWMMSPWRPSYHFQFKVIRELFPFGSRVLFTGIVSAVSSNVSRILIGKFYLAADLGYVERAHSLARKPFDGLTLMMARVLFPSFSSIQNKKNLLMAGFRKSLKTCALLIFPILIGMVFCARPIVLALLTEKWAPIIPYVQILAIESLFTPFFVIHLNLFKACGRSDLLLNTTILNKIMTVIAILIASVFGITAMLLAQFGVSVVSYGLVCVITSRLTDYPISRQIMDWIPYMTIALVMGSGIAIVRLLPIDNIWLQLLSQISVGAVIFILVCGVAKMSAFLELKDILVSKLKNIRQFQVS
jgi:O-antigen/teichoic acid export membrane protein